MVISPCLLQQPPASLAPLAPSVTRKLSWQTLPPTPVEMVSSALEEQSRLTQPTLQLRVANSAPLVLTVQEGCNIRASWEHTSRMWVSPVALAVLQGSTATQQG